MKISEEILHESLIAVEKGLNKAKKEGPSFIQQTLEQISEKDEQIGRFIKAVYESWEEDPPLTVGEQITVLLLHLTILAEMFWRQAEVDELERKFDV